MKAGLHMRIMSFAIMVMYVFSVIGFDVHVSRDSGRAYFEMLSSGISCESIHPDHPCHHCAGGCCGGHHSDGDEDNCVDGEDCCSDCIGVLTLTGADSPSIDLQAYPASAAVLPAPASDPAGQSWSALRPAFRSPPRAALSRLCILRV